MADYNGTQLTGLGDQTAGNGAVLGGLSTNADATKSVPNQVFASALLPSITPFGGLREATYASATSSHGVNDHTGYEHGGPHQYWFEHVHVVPDIIELGNLLAVVVRDIEIYNSYRESTRQLTAAANNVDSGVSFQNLPSLPYNIPSQNSLVFQVKIDTSGPPDIEGTLDFTMDSGSFSVTISGVRVVMFAFEPEAPVTETLEWYTQVLEAVDGTEQRLSMRKCPRQIFNLSFKMEDDATRRFFQSLIYGFQPGTMGVPIWSDARLLTQGITASDTTIYLNTRHADFRAQSLILIWKDANNYDALEVSTVNADSLVLSSGVLNDYAIGETLVMPLRVGLTDQTVRVDKHPVNLDEVQMQFVVTENDVDLADDSFYSKHNGFVLLDDANLLQSGGTLDDSFLRKMGRLDNLLAAPLQYSDWNSSRFTTTKAWVCNTSEQIWRVRQLVHALRGSQVSFYLPTFRHDIVVADNLAVGSFLMDIEWIGYDSLIQATEPNASLWIELVDGTILTREVQSSDVLSATVERLTVDVSWPSTITPAEINRVSFLRLCRIADDRVQFKHGYSGQAQVAMQVLAVQS